MAFETQLSGSAAPIQISTSNYSLHAPGLKGKIKELDKEEQTTRGGGAKDRNHQNWLNASKDSETFLLKQFEIEVVSDEHKLAKDTATRSGGLKATTAKGEAAMVLATPRTRANMEQAILYTDENGESRWVWPDRKDEASFQFNIPREGAELPPDEENKTRGAITKGIRRTIKVFAWLIDPLAELAAGVVVKNWEEKKRPYGLHYVQPKLFGGDIPWENVKSGRALLLLHGTFSAGQIAYEGLINSIWMEKLAELYGGRIFAFNHPSLHHSPTRNVEELLKMLPPDVKNLDLDIITHSRGGLVGRELTERLDEINPTDKNIKVRRAIFVAGPHNGTILTDKDNWLKLIDAYTNMLTDLPDNPFTITMEALITFIKVAASGAIKGLPGLQAMLPGGEFLQKLNGCPSLGTEYYAIGARYVPQDENLFARFGKRLIMKALSQVFGEDSDMVVPTKGCFETEPMAPCFPIEDARKKVFDLDTDINHLNYFDNELVNKQLFNWLSAN